MSVIREFLISVGFAADERSASATESRIKRVEATARKSDEARTKSAAEQGMERARQALKAAGVENASMAQIMAKRKELDAVEAAGAKNRQEYERRQTHSRAEAAAGLRTISTVAIGAAVAVQAATVAFAGFATQVAGKLEAMAYASERTGSSVKELKTFSQAVSQLGGTAGGALNDLENFAGRLRSNPQGYTAFLKSVGVEARDAKGNIKGAAQLYKEFRAEVGKRKPYEEQLLYGQEIGVSEETWRASDPEKLAAEEAALRAKHARMGFDPDAAKEDAKGLQHAFRDMWDSISIVGEKAASKIFADVGGNIQSFTTFIEQHGDQIAEILSKVAQIVLAVSRAFLELATSDKVKGFLDGLLNTFGKVDEVTGQWTADTEKIKDVLEALAVFVATVFVAKITNAFKDVLKEAKPLLALLAPFLKFLGIGGSIGVGVAVGSAVGTDAAVPGAQKPGVTNHWDDEASGAAGGAGIGGALKRAWQWGKNAVGMGGAGTQAKPPEAEGKYRPVYKLGEADLSQRTADVIAGEAQRKNPESIDAVINNMLNRVGSKGWGPSGNLEEVATAPGQYEAAAKGSKASAAETAFIQARIKAIASGGVPDNTSGSNSFRMEGYYQGEGANKTWARTARIGANVGGNRYGFVPGVPNGPYAPYAEPKGGSKEVAGGFHPLDGQGRLTSDISAARVNPVTGQIRPHKGIDLAAPAGTNVKSMTDGIVSIGSHGDITIKQASGASTTYRHVTPSVEDGARVAAGSIIAQLKANDPRSTGPHLHLEARDKEGTLLDPKSLLAPKPESNVADQAKGVVNRFNDAIGRLDTTKLRAFGEATQGFDPGKFFTVPPAGTEGTTNNSSVRHQTFNGGTTNITQNVQGGADEGAAVFRRHKERQNADDVRYASSVFA